MENTADLSFKRYSVIQIPRELVLVFFRVNQTNSLSETEMKEAETW